MSLWEPEHAEYLSGLEIEPKKQERQLLFKVNIIEPIKLQLTHIHTVCICVCVCVSLPNSKRGTRKCNHIWNGLVIGKKCGLWSLRWNIKVLDMN